MRTHPSLVGLGKVYGDKYPVLVTSLNLIGL